MKKLLVVLAVLAGLLVGGCGPNGKEDKGMVYVADTDNGKIVILDDDLNFMDSFNAICYQVEVDANYIFVARTGDIYKYSKIPPYTQLDWVSTRGIGGMGQDDTYIYIGVTKIGGKYVQKYKKSDLSFVDEFLTGHTFGIDGVAVDDTYIYVHDGGGMDLKKFRKSDYGLEWTVEIDGSYYPWLGLDEYGNYLFFTSGPGNGAALSINYKSDGSNYKRIEGISTFGWDASGKSGYAYVVDYTDGKVRKVDLSTDEIVATYSGMNLPRNVAWYPSSPPTAPTELLCNGATNPVDVIPQYFSAIYNDPDSGDKAKHYKIQVNKLNNFTGRMVWDSGKTAMSDVNEGQRCSNIGYNGQALSLNKIKYYWRIKFWDSEGNEGVWSDPANFTMAGSGAGEMGAGPWEEDTLEPSGEVKVEIPRRSGEWTALEDIMRIHTNVNKNPLDAMEKAQAEVICCNISKNFNSFEEASSWYKQLEGYAVQISVGCKVGGTPISRKLFTGIISSVDANRLNQTAEIRVGDFLDYFGRVTIKETPVWENISLTQLYKNLVELAFPEWEEGVDYFVEDLGGSTIPAIGYEDLNLLSELKNIAESRGMRIFTDVNGKLVCRSRAVEGDPWDIKHDYNLEDVTERRDINGVINWVIVHARPHEIAPDVEAPGKISGFTATPGDTKIDLTWSNPTDDDFVKVKIQFSTTGYPTNSDDGQNIYEGTGQSKEHTGLVNGKRYYYSAFTLDEAGNWSDAAHTSAVAGVGGGTWEDDTGTSRIGWFRAEPGSEVIVLTWQNPKVTNFDLVMIRGSDSGYPSSPTSGSQVYQGTRETVTDTNLDNGKRYYYSAFVKNTEGQWSSAQFASAVPAGARVVLYKQYVTFKRCIKTGATWEIYCPGYGNSWSATRNLDLPGVDKRTSGWLRFKHEWDIHIYSGSKYPGSEKHVVGANDDLSLSFSHDCGGICKVTVTLITVTSHFVRVQYKLSYSGGMALKIEARNKLYLMG